MKTQPRGSNYSCQYKEITRPDPLGGEKIKKEIIYTSRRSMQNKEKIGKIPMEKGD